MNISTVNIVTTNVKNKAFLKKPNNKKYVGQKVKNMGKISTVILKLNTHIIDEHGDARKSLIFVSSKCMFTMADKRGRSYLSFAILDPFFSSFLF